MMFKIIFFSPFLFVIRIIFAETRSYSSERFEAVKLQGFNYQAKFVALLRGLHVHANLKAVRNTQKFVFTSRTGRFSGIGSQTKRSLNVVEERITRGARPVEHICRDMREYELAKDLKRYPDSKENRFISDDEHML